MGGGGVFSDHPGQPGRGRDGGRERERRCGMNVLVIAWKSIRERALVSGLTMLSVALGVALMVTVLVINGIVTKVFNQSSSGYDLVVGAKGS